MDRRKHKKAGWFISTIFEDVNPINRETTNDILEDKRKKSEVEEDTQILDVSYNQDKARKIIIMGGPASGKGTQCEWIASKYNLVHLSTGDMLREAVKNGLENGVGAVAKSFMDEGRLVPDDIMVKIVTDRLSQPDCRDHGWLLDGFPRTRAQADALSALGVKPDSFLFLNASDETLIERVVGRRMDSETGKIYHTQFNPPPENIISRLTQRSDDTKEKMISRLSQFHDNVSSVRQFYEEILVEVDASLSPDAVAIQVEEAINSMGKLQIS
jgi:adenylate kinase